MGFRFRLETVLNVKARKEEECRFKLAAEEHRLQVKTMELNRSEEAHLEGLAELASASQGRVDLNYLATCHTYVGRLKQLQEICRVELDRVRKDVTHAREELVAARKESKAMEQLKERDYREYLREEHAKEQKFLDELGINSHHRKQG